MPTSRETVLAALLARMQPLAALVLRDEVLPERTPAAGLIILRDGQPGNPGRPDCQTEIYRVSPADTDDPAKWMTELLVKIMD